MLQTGAGPSVNLSRSGIGLSASVKGARRRRTERCPDIRRERGTSGLLTVPSRQLVYFAGLLWDDAREAERGFMGASSLDFGTARPTRNEQSVMDSRIRVSDSAVAEAQKAMISVRIPSVNEKPAREN
jgi:hypothetical protein